MEKDMNINETNEFNEIDETDETDESFDTKDKNALKIEKINQNINEDAAHTDFDPMKKSHSRKNIMNENPSPRKISNASQNIKSQNTQNYSNMNDYSEGLVEDYDKYSEYQNNFQNAYHEGHSIKNDGISLEEIHPKFPLDLNQLNQDHISSFPDFHQQQSFLSSQNTLLFPSPKFMNTSWRQELHNSSFGLSTKFALETLTKEVDALFKTLSRGRYTWVGKSFFELGPARVIMTLVMILCFFLLLAGAVMKWIDYASSISNSKTVWPSIRITIELFLLLFSIIICDGLILLEGWKKYRGSIITLKLRVNKFLKEAVDIDTGDVYRYNIDSMNSVPAFRDGTWKRLPYSLLVKGDILYSRFPKDDFEQQNLDYEPIPNFPNYYLLKYSVLPILLEDALPPHIKNQKRPIHSAIRLFTKPFTILLILTLLITYIVLMILYFTKVIDFNWDSLFVIPVYIVLFLLPVGFPMIWLLIHVIAKATLATVQTTFTSMEYIEEITTGIQKNRTKTSFSLFWKNFAKFLVRMLDPALDDIFHLGSISNLCCVNIDGILSDPNFTPLLIYMVQSREILPSQTNSIKDAVTNPITDAYILDQNQNNLEYNNNIEQEQDCTEMDGQDYVESELVAEGDNLQNRDQYQDSTLTPEEDSLNKEDRENINETFPESFQSSNIDSSQENEVLSHQNNSLSNLHLQNFLNSRIIMDSTPVTPTLDSFSISQFKSNKNEYENNYSQNPNLKNDTYESGPDDSEQDSKFKTYDVKIEYIEENEPEKDNQKFNNIHNLKTNDNLNNRLSVPHERSVDDFSETDQPSMNRNISTNGVQLDLIFNEESREFQFVDSNWMTFHSTLKAIGFSFLVTYRMMPELDLSPIDHDMSYLWKPHLYQLSKQIGFEDNVLDKLSPKMKISTRRKELHFVSRVIKYEDDLQMHSYGHPEILLDYCTDFFDGYDIRPITQEVRDHLLSMHNDWEDKQNLQVVAFSYKPVDAEYHSIVNTHVNRSITIEDDLVVDSNSAEYKFLHFQNSQIFLGMTAFQKKGLQYLTDLIQTLTDESGIRFSYFSKKNLFSTKAFGQTLGLETSWNSCISLSDPSKPVQLDSYYKNARLPVGIEALKKHIRNVDDVPLSVSLFCDATPKSTRQMMGILQENKDIVCCIGSSASTNNIPLFSQADISIAVDPHSDQVPDCTLTKNYEKMKRLATAPCSFHIPEHSTKNAFKIIFHLIRECRRQVANIQQSFMFLVGANLTLYFIQAIGSIFIFPIMVNGLQAFWMMLVIIPIFCIALMSNASDPKLMTYITLKNSYYKHWHEMLFMFIEILLRFFIPIPLCIIVNVWTILSMPEVSKHGGLTSYWFGKLNRSLNNTNSFEIALLYGQNFMLLYLILHFCFISMGYMSEIHSIFKIQLWKNLRLLFAMFLVLTLQILFTVIQIALHHIENNAAKDYYPKLPFYFYLIFIIFPPLNLIIPELLKIRKRKKFLHEQTKEKLLFETRLGMHSPK